MSQRTNPINIWQSLLHQIINVIYHISNAYDVDTINNLPDHYDQEVFDVVANLHNNKHFG